MGLIGIIFQILFVNILSLTNPDLLSNINLLSILSSFCNYILPIPIFIYLMRKLECQKIRKDRLGIERLAIYVSVSFTLIFFGNLIGISITSIISSFTHNSIANPVENLVNSTNIILNIFLISFIGPIFEELFFRKLLIDRTVTYGAKVSIITSATLFAFFHGNLNQFFYAFLLGGFLAYVYLETGRIIYPIIIHMFVNLMGSVVSLFCKSRIIAITEGAFAFTDVIIVLIYLIIMSSLIFTGIMGLLHYRKNKLLKSKMPISLKTVFLNYGMICFILFFTFLIINQMIY